MFKKFVLSSVLILASLGAEAETLSKKKFEKAVDVLTEPGTLVPSPAKECSPEEKLAIDCRLKIEKLFEYYKKLKEDARLRIDNDRYDLNKMFETVKLDALKSVVDEYRKEQIHKDVKDIEDPKQKKKAIEANMKATKKSRAKIMKLTGIVDKDVNCLMGPDMFYLWDAKINKCSSGFTHVDPHIVTTTKVVENEEGELSLVICRKADYEAFSLGYELCGSKDLEYGATWISTNEAKQNVREIKEVQGPKVGGAKNFFIVRGEKFDIFKDVRDMVEQVVAKKHKKCLPFVPAPLN